MSAYSNWSSSLKNNMMTTYGEQVVLRKTTITNLQSGGNYVVGDSLINLAGCPFGYQGVIPGDIFGSWPYEITNTVTPVLGALLGVKFSPSLSMQIDVAEKVCITNNSDYIVSAKVKTYDSKLIDNTTITVNDLKVTLSTTTLYGTTTPTPVVGSDNIIINGHSRSIGMVTPIYAANTVVAWECLAKG